MIINFRSALALLLMMTSVFLNAAQALAAAPIREQLAPDARQDWDAARELYDAGDYRSALVHFQKAYELSQNPRVLFNVGVCLKDLTQYAEAIRVWERELSFRAELDPKDAEQVEFAIAAASRFVSSLRIDSDQPGAVLSIDGTEVGKTPFIAPIPIDVGRRKVSLGKDGFTPNETTVDVVQGVPVSLSLNLTPLLKTGNVSIAVTGAVTVSLFMDGRELGPAPYQGQLPAGPHTFEARAVGFETARQTTEVEYGKTLRLTLAVAEARNEGKVRIITDQREAAIAIDGELKGHGAWEGILRAGGHQLRVEKAGYSVFTDDISLSRDQERTVDVRLAKKQSWVWWTVGIVAVVGGGAAAAVLLGRSTETSPVSGTLDTVSPQF